jgi:hypothetical protein
VLPVDDGGAKAADGVTEIDIVGFAEVLEAQDAFFGAGIGGKNVAALDAGEQAAVYGRCHKPPVFLDEDVVDGAFGDFSVLIQEEDVVIPRGGCGLEGFRVQRSMGGFVAVHGISGIGALGSDTDADGFG